MSSNMSTGQAAGYVIGAVVGYFVPVVGIPLGASIGGMIGGLADPPKGPTTTSVGPRLTDQSVQGASYGAMIPDVYGSMALKGNVIWVENNQLKESVTTTTTRSGGKGGGGRSKSTSTTYTYSATFAVGLCKGPISGIRRIWAGSKLIYDANASDMASIIASNQAASGFTIYTGTETQNPDPRMQAALGVANTPAYRGLAYIVFYDFQLRDYGNSLLGAQIRVEIVSSGTSSYNEQVVGSVDINVNNIGWPSVCWSDSYSYIYGRRGSIVNPDIFTYLEYRLTNGVVSVTNSNTSTIQSLSLYTIQWLQQSEGECIIYIYGSGTGKILRKGQINKTVKLPLNFNFNKGCKYSNGYAVLSLVDGYGLQLIKINDDGYQIKTRSYSAEPYKIFASKSGNPYVYDVNGYLYELDGRLNYTGRRWAMPGTDFQLLDVSGSKFTFSASQGAYTYFYTAVDAGSESVSVTHVSSTAVFGLSAATAVLVAEDLVIAPVWISSIISFWMYNLRTNVQASANSLMNIIESQCLKSKILSSSDLTFESMSDTINGFKIGSYGPIRRNIEPLQKAWPFDVFQSGYKIKFKSRGSSSVRTIYDSDLGSTVDKSQHQFIRSRDMDSMIPNRVSLVFIDTDREYDAGEQFAERITKESVSEVVIDLPIALDSSTAAQMAEILLYIFWLEREDFSFKLPPSFIDLEPSDVITFNSATNGLYEFRITSLNYTSNNIIEVSVKLNSQSVYYSIATGEPGQSNNAGVDSGGPSQGFALDIPLIDSAMNTTGLLLAAYGFSSTWPGCVVSKSIDDQSWFDVQSIGMSCTIGLAANALPIGRTDIIDKLNVLTVGIIVGSLYSVSESLMLSGENHFAVGSHSRWEIIAAQTCTEISAGIYELTNLLRGRAGTEWAMSTHLIGDTVVLLDYDELAYVNTPANDLNTTRSYKFISFNSNVESTVPVSLPYTGVNLECLSPVYLNGSRNATGDWDLSWVRRTRIGGEWTNGSDVPVSESFERYEVDVFTDATYATVVRTISSVTSSCSYTSANQVTDFGSNQSTLYLTIYQLSELVGRGYPLQSSITR